MDRKAIGGHVEVKDSAKGLVTAAFCTFDVVDHDGDIIERAAIPDGAPIRVSAYGHKTWEGALPVGKGVIRTTPTEAIAELQFFLKTTDGSDTFEVVKEMGDLQEWSWGFDVLASEPTTVDGRKVRRIKRTQVHEVSPVLLGAGIGTRTLAVKSAEDWRNHPALIAAIKWFEENERQEREASAFLRDIAAKNCLREAEHTLDELDATRWYGYIRTTDPNGYLTSLAYKVIKMCSDELGIPMLKQPIIEWFTEEDPAARAFAKKTNTFHVGDRLPDVPIPLLGLADLANNVIWVKKGQSVPETINTVAHEVAHVAGLLHPEADAFGNRWGRGFTLDND